MCYLVAKDPEKRGCYAIKTTHGKALVALKKYLNSMTRDKGIQFVTISRPMAFREYAPCTFAEDANEFIELVQAMIEKEKRE